MKHVMVDLETLGVGYRPVIVSIGAVVFSPGRPETGEEFYGKIDAVEAEAAGLHIEAGTVKWWLQQSEAARKVFKGGDALRDELLRFLDWMGTGTRLWGNGSNFDNRILREAYEVVGMRCPWHYRDDRDMRTFMDLHPGVDVEREGTHHHALDDAKFQVQCMAAAAAAGDRANKPPDVARLERALAEERRFTEALLDEGGFNTERVEHLRKTAVAAAAGAVE